MGRKSTLHCCLLKFKLFRVPLLPSSILSITFLTAPATDIISLVILIQDHLGLPQLPQLFHIPLSQAPSYTASSSVCSSILSIRCFIFFLFAWFTDQDQFPSPIFSLPNTFPQSSLSSCCHPEFHNGNTCGSWGGLSEWSVGGKLGKHRASPQCGCGCVASGERERKIFCNTRDRCMVVPSPEEQEQEPGTPEGDK